MTISLLQRQSLGYIPPTPLTPVLSDSVTPTTHELLFSVANFLGHPVGYLQEQQGNLVQNILPNPKTEYSQISTSSKVNLDLHTESCFHPYLPDYVLLLCLRGDPAAATTYADLDDILPDLSDKSIEILKQPWFRTSVDESFRTNGEPDQPRDLPVLYELPDGTHRMKYDKAVMVGLWKDAVSALEELNEVIEKHTSTVFLQTGDLLVIDNATTVHGRRPFQARYDGTDRWLQRVLVRKSVKDMPHQHCLKTGYLIITKYTE
ncbi:viomycin_VioC, arginine beta-hydroxylase, Fe(II)/alpha-ketoglutarate-dependent [uncultured Caudovirales phage]|uniref:Viomycin_VioC, arginine beta-hydroxylase, Fe(II)/alpha-ketoglutarate-dependent n=1 Tax=uncultured Caudovirales phage TaxID=2100421 RepID=A0A6J5QSF2_9CAUD|nr:viomycin_VioC, arginine beta-hydroxylase, Fe(II)/alpha-ketoglutarate-dependent [uncultured Caudovirales phage]